VSGKTSIFISSTLTYDIHVSDWRWFNFNFKLQALNQECVDQGPTHKRASPFVITARRTESETSIQAALAIILAQKRAGLWKKVDIE
jgi:hypothetical protein